MPSYYLDIETTGLDPKKDKIISIQYQPLDMNTGEPIGELIILKEWESSEKEMLKKFLLDSRVLDEYSFSFVPIGFNLGFEHNFLKQRTLFHGLPEIDILSKPFIDLRAIAILMNKGQFKGSGLNNMTGKKSSGTKIPIFYETKNYEEIIRYIKNETEEFLKFNAWLYKEMPELYKKFKEEVLGR
jgi:DNA polymerase III epsilon subunit-like protein